MATFSNEIQNITQAALDAGIIARLTKATKAEWWLIFQDLLNSRKEKSD